MKANELMIGDWVLDKKTNRPYKIIGTNDLLFHDDYSHIQLTAEILEKNGFIKYNEVSDTPPYDRDEEGNMYYSYKGEQKFWGWWQPDNIFFIPANAMGNIEIKFVHQLQHALRLCNIEKEIEL
ncbi:MAG: hypothetical protein IIZ94_12315 [Prevotella sp.]|nr:hypothetical protein [Prevotella sp.]